MCGDDAIEAIHEAERTVYHAQWRIWEELALEVLARTRGLARVPLVPGSEVIQLVAYDGEHLGHVRRDSAREPAECWIAVTRERYAGTYPSAGEAAGALARACGKQPRRTR
jgi:hypothetical protein